MPLFDDERIEELRAVLGGEQVAILLAAFARELAHRPSLLRECVDRGADADIRKAAHLFRGAALSVGALRVANVAHDLEHASAAAIVGLADLFCRVAEQTSTALQHHRSALQAG